MNVMKKTQNKESLFAYKHSGGKGGIYMMLHGKERLVHPYALYEALWNGREKLRLCHGVDARFLKCATEVEGVYFDDGEGDLHTRHVCRRTHPLRVVQETAGAKGTIPGLLAIVRA